MKVDSSIPEIGLFGVRVEWAAHYWAVQREGTDRDIH